MANNPEERPDAAGRMTGALDKLKKAMEDLKESLKKSDDDPKN